MTKRFSVFSGSRRNHIARNESEREKSTGQKSADSFPVRTAADKGVPHGMR